MQHALRCLIDRKSQGLVSIVDKLLVRRGQLPLNLRFCSSEGGFQHDLNAIGVGDIGCLFLEPLNVSLELLWILLALTLEVGHYLNTILDVLDTPDIKKAFDANTKWDVIEIVSNRYLGGVAEPSQRAKMAESGRRILQFVADNDFKTAIDPILFQSELRPMGPHADAWIAAYRMTPEGSRFAGVTPTLRRLVSPNSAMA